MSSDAIIDMKVVPLQIGSAAGTAKPSPIPIKVSSDFVFEIGDYEKLNNKPSINGVELIGNKTSADLGIGQTYVHNQAQASSEWTIHHGLKKYPSVSIVDSAGSVVFGDIQYIDDNNLVCRFSSAFSGKAYLN